MAIETFGNLEDIRVQGLIAILSHPELTFSVEREFKPYPLPYGGDRHLGNSSTFHFNLSPQAVHGGVYATKLSFGSVDFEEIRQTLLPLLAELLARRNNRDVRQEPEEPETFMGEPVVRGYEVQREQVHQLFKLLGFSGTAEVHQIMAKAIEKLSQPSEKADG